jgi:hypothetical protein
MDTVQKTMARLVQENHDLHAALARVKRAQLALAVALCIPLVCAFLMGAAASNKTDTTTPNKIVLKDSNGKDRIVLDPDQNGGASVVVYDDEGGTVSLYGGTSSGGDLARVGLQTVKKKGFAWIANNEDGTPFVWMSNDYGIIPFAAAVDNGTGRLLIGRTDGRASLSLSIDNEVPSMSMADDKGTKALVSVKNGGPVVRLQDEPMKVHSVHLSLPSVKIEQGRLKIVPSQETGRP